MFECIPHGLATELGGELEIPTIGIGAGPGCDGQVLVFHDLLGFDEDFRPRFVRRYANARRTLGDAIASFAADVRRGEFPSMDESFESTTEATTPEAGGTGRRP